LITNLYSSPATITGTVADNVPVTGVWYQVNSGGWQEASGTTNWTASFTPAYGVTNVIQAYTVNDFGLRSTTNTLLVKYLAGAVLTLNANGLGSITPNLNNDLLPLGTNYVVTAAATNGFAFTGWTGSTITTNPVLNFAMATNSSFTANFADVTPPANVIYNLVNGQQVSNNVFTVYGAASDNWQLAGVEYQFNNGGWTNATGSNNWSAMLNLRSGSNTFQVFACDTAGNRSRTNTLIFNYVVSAQLLQLGVTGYGGFTADYTTNTWLAVGQKYTITAVAGFGFAFTNWTGSFSTNKAALTFTMASNLSFTANFADVASPFINITNLGNGQQLSNNVFTVSGDAGDNWQLAAVKCQFNGAGWTNATGLFGWSATLALQPGPNVFQVYAIDTYGNYSPTSSVSFSYVVSARLPLFTTGLGTISPNDSNAWLQVGKNYTLTAIAAPGFAFTNWTGSLTNYAASLSFTLVSNLSFTANFVDVTRPTIATTNLVTGQQVSNSLFTVRGTAGDNWQLTGVEYQLNSAGWTNATGGANWSATVNLRPGTNLFQAYSLDSSGNHSLTNSLAVIYVVSAPLQLSATGLGTITPNDSNAWLQVGRNYTLTAKAAAGFAFTNWTGSLGASQAALSFTMTSNLSFTANFVDVTPPTMAITNLVNGQQVSNSVFLVRGTAADNWQLAGVDYQLNNGGWLTATGGANWSAALNLVSGTNLLQAFAVDSTGNHSLTNTLKLVYIVSAQLQLFTTGSGTITPNDSNAWLQVGRNYAVTAVPAKGWLLYNWTGEYLNPLTNHATLAFTMPPGLELTANFYQPPAILIQPANVLAFYGGAATFTVSATGTGPLTYQWQGSTTNLPGQNASTLSLTTTSQDNGGNYRVIVSEYSSSVTSSVAKLTLTNIPASMAGLDTIVTPAGRSSFQVSFGASTFSEFSLDTNYEDSAAGSYEYATLGGIPGVSPWSAQLSLANQQPPDAVSNGTQVIDLTFVSPGWAVFTNGESAGTIQYYTATNLVPNSWTNHKLVLTSTGQTNTLSLTSTNNYTDAGSTGTYTATVFSPVAAWLKFSPSVIPAFGDINYLQLQFTTATNGGYLLEEYNNESASPVLEQQGSFNWK